MQKELLEINFKDHPYVRDIVRDEILLNMIFRISGSGKQFELSTFEFLNNPNDPRNSSSFREWALKWKN